MSQAFWAGDSIATSIEAAGARSRANATLQKQQALHCGDIVLQRAAMAALESIDPTHPLLNSIVQKRIEKIGQRTYYKNGWTKGISLVINPDEILSDLQTEHELQKRVARRQAEAEVIQKKQVGLPFLTRRTVFRWGRTEYSTLAAAEQARAYRLASIDCSKLGDNL